MWVGFITTALLMLSAKRKERKFFLPSSNSSTNAFWKTVSLLFVRWSPESQHEAATYRSIGVKSRKGLFPLAARIGFIMLKMYSRAEHCAVL